MWPLSRHLQKQVAIPFTMAIIFFFKRPFDVQQWYFVASHEVSVASTNLDKISFAFIYALH